MSDSYTGKEKREFLRYNHEKPVQYKILNPADGKSVSAEVINAVTKNLSVSGVLFTSRFLPEISSILVLDLDYRTSRICQEIEKRALLVGNRMIGKVVRIEESDNGLYDVGVAFVRKTDKMPKDIKELLK